MEPIGAHVVLLADVKGEVCMKSILTATLVAATVSIAAPAFAQGVYFGPGGVGVDLGHRRDGYDRERYRDDYRGRDRNYEGRSAYDGRGRYDRDRY